MDSRKRVSMVARICPRQSRSVRRLTVALPGLLAFAVTLGCDPPPATNAPAQDSAPNSAPRTSQASNGASVANRVRGRVAWVIDGDSLVFQSDSGERFTLRLEGIDCPEKGQPFAAEAAGLARRWTENNIVEFTAKGTDKYGRTLADVYVGNGWVNAELVGAGLAWHYVRYNNNADLARLQRNAQQQRIGIWSVETPEPPWDYRQRMPRR